MTFDSLQAAVRYQVEKQREEKELIIKAWVEGNLPFIREQGVEVYNIEDVIERLKRADELEHENEFLKKELENMKNGKED